MESRFRLKLMLTMIAFAMSICILLAVVDHNRIKGQIIDNKEDQMAKSEELIISSIETIEKAYHVFGEHIANAMRETTYALNELYEVQPDFDQWDFEGLKTQYGFDIYIIDEEAVITHSSLREDIGLDFKICCSGLAKKLNDRRISGDFFHDGIDIEQQTGILKKYSYMATPDKKYIIELGYNLQGGEIFEEFNFFTTFEELIENDPSIMDIHILNSIGYALGHSTDYTTLPEGQRSVFSHTLSTQETTVARGEWNGEKAYFRYIYYESKYDTGTATNRKVLQIIYNDQDLQKMLSTNQAFFTGQLLTVLAVTIILSLFISKAVAKPMHLAFHDSLTKLRNRAGFEESIAKELKSRQGRMALFMMDMDNFKQVNDKYGHDVGDQLLQCVASGIQKATRKQDTAARLGGDEFIMIMPDTTCQEAELMSRSLLRSIQQSIASNEMLADARTTVSIGIAFCPDHGEDLETLKKHADEALYLSKKSGKNQFRVFKA